MRNSICIFPQTPGRLDEFSQGNCPGPHVIQMSCLSFKHAFNEHLLVARHGDEAKMCSLQPLFLGLRQLIMEPRKACIQSWEPL